MKSRFPLVFLWVLFCLASFAVIDCSKNEEKNLASGYTEENNAWNGLDSTLAKLLETWDSEVASDSVERRGTGEAEGKSWYEVEFMTEGEVVYVKEDDSSKAVVVLSVYERENGLQLKMETDSKMCITIPRCWNAIPYLSGGRRAFPSGGVRPSRRGSSGACTRHRFRT